MSFMVNVGKNKDGQVILAVSADTQMGVYAMSETQASDYLTLLVSSRIKYTKVPGRKVGSAQAALVAWEAASDRSHDQQSAARQDVYENDFCSGYVRYDRWQHTCEWTGTTWWCDSVTDLN
jgi:hypothetical protein